MKVVRGWHLNPGLLLLVVALLALGVACSGDDPPEVVEPTATPTEATPEPTPTPATPTETPSPTPTITVPTATPTPEPTPEPEPYDGQLVAMRLPALGVEAPIEPIGLIEGQNKLDVPEWHNIGWYHIYDKPGFGTSSLYSAHKDYYPNKRGPFYALTELKDGDQIIVVMDDGREYVYEVFFQRRYTRDTIPMHDLIWPHKARDPELLRPEDEEWITLYTCGGDFVARTEGGPGYYIHRDVVIGRLVDTILPESLRATDEGER